MKNPYNPITEPASFKWFEEKHDKTPDLCKTYPSPESEQAKEESVSNRYVYKNEALDIFKSIEADSFERKHIPVENEMWRDGYLNGYIIGREKSQQSQSAVIKAVLEYVVKHKRSLLTVTNEVTAITWERNGKADFVDINTTAILSMRPKIEKQLSKK
jgi:hypothetical protein